MTKGNVLPRVTPDRDSKYMGLCWVYASFSKDPNTQVGACIVSYDNFPLGSGYNGPPRVMSDNAVVWDRPPKDDPEAFSKYDIIVHAEINAIDHTNCADLRNSTLYVTALPCPKCMLEIVRKQIKRVVYMDYQATSSSSLQNAKWREKSLRIADLGNIRLDQFLGDINWLQDWMLKLNDIGVLGF